MRHSLAELPLRIGPNQSPRADPDPEFGRIYLRYEPLTISDQLRPVGLDRSPHGKPHGPPQETKVERPEAWSQRRAWSRCRGLISEVGVCTAGSGKVCNPMAIDRRRPYRRACPASRPA